MLHHIPSRLVPFIHVLSHCNARYSDLWIYMRWRGMDIYCIELIVYIWCCFPRTGYVNLCTFLLESCVGLMCSIMWNLRWRLYLVQILKIHPCFRVGSLVWFASTRCPTVELLWLALWWLKVDCIVLTSISLLRWFPSPSLSSMETELLLSTSRFRLPFSWMFWIYCTGFAWSLVSGLKRLTKLSLSRSRFLILVLKSDVIKQRFRFLSRNSLRFCKSLNLSLFRSY